MNPRVDVEWRAQARLPNRVAQRVNLRHQQVRPAVEQIHREKECSTRNWIATIVRHKRIMRNLEERRNALRFSALRLLQRLNAVVRSSSGPGQFMLWEIAH
jgi:hypothetical protein